MRNMGCLSSKIVMARTSSYCYSHRDDHINNHATTATLLSPPTLSSTLHPDTKHTIDALELMAGLDSDPPSPQHDVLAANMTTGHVGANSRRSKSCQLSPQQDHALLVSASKYDEFGKGTMGRCRSFHTVEEYDALLQRICSLQKPEAKDDVELLGVPNTNFNQVKKDSYEMKSKIDRRADERGIKRKKAREGLAGSLQMGNKNNHYNNIEFQTVGSLRQWLDVHVYSPGAPTYSATPKFGSYHNNNNNTQAPGEDSVLVETGNGKQQEESEIEVDPELVAAFEECMQRLQVEEDSILEQIEANLYIHNSEPTWKGHV